MGILAINNGTKVRTKKFPAYKIFGEEEKRAATRVIESGILSKFLGSWHPNFYGGPEVKAFEAEWASYYGVKHAIAVNSATSGIYCAVGAIEAGPGDEIIVSPYSMSCSATAPLVYNAIPVFADIEEDYFCLSPESVAEKITKHTKAIIVVDLLGQPYDRDKINEIARKNNLFVIEDCAQAPGAKYQDKFAGTLGDIGIFSLNYHKHIHTGEGGMVVTDNDDLAEKIRLIRNHAEAVVEGKGVTNLINMIGFNYRMTELEAAIGREQLKKLDILLEKRIKNVEYLAGELSKIPCIQPAKTRPECTHSYYLHALKFDQEAAGIHRNVFVEAVKAELAPTELREEEGIRVVAGYVKPLYLQPLFQEKTAYTKNCPWGCSHYNKEVDYHEGLCPTVEKINKDEIIIHDLMKAGLEQEDLDDVIKAFDKVWKNIDELR
jgi:perosamine synthetase